MYCIYSSLNKIFTIINVNY